MANFATFIRTIPDKIAPPVKIAVLSDGVDAALDILDGKIAWSKSFWPYQNSIDMMDQYSVPSGTRGTTMAILISQMCPKSLLYVGRLEEHERKITARSAAVVRPLLPASTFHPFNSDI